MNTQIITEIDNYVEITKNCTHHNIDYTLNLKSENGVLFIELEQSFDLNFSLWKNQFTAAYIEDLTSKTGQKKQFPEFLNIMITAIEQPNLSNMQLDILTFQDLEEMRAKKTGQKAEPSSIAKQQKANKRYLILSSISEEEKVHYPLSLNFESNLDQERIKKAISRIKQQMIELKQQKETQPAYNLKYESSFSDLEDKKFEKQNQSHQSHQSRNSLHSIQDSDNLKVQNELLRTKVKRMEESNIHRKIIQENEQLLKNKTELEQKYGQLKRYSTDEIQRIKILIEQREQEIIQKRNELLELKKQGSLSWENDEAGKRLRIHILKISEENDKESLIQKKNIFNQLQEIDKITLDLENYQKFDRKQRNRIKQLEIEINSAQSRGKIGGVQDRLYSPYSQNSPQSTISSKVRANSGPIKYSPASKSQSGKSLAVTTSKQPVNVRSQSNDRMQNNLNRNKVSPIYSYNNKKQIPQSSKSPSTNILYKPVISQNQNNARKQPSSTIFQKQQNNYAKGPIDNQKRSRFPSYGNNRVNQNQNQKNVVKNYGNRVVSPVNNKRFSPNTNQRNDVKSYQQKNISPGKYSNYNISNSKNNIQQSKIVQQQRIQNSNINKNTDLDNRLSKLENLLNKNKK